MDVRRKSVLKGLFNIPLCMLIIFLALTFFLEPIRLGDFGIEFYVLYWVVTIAICIVVQLIYSYIHLKALEERGRFVFLVSRKHGYIYGLFLSILIFAVKRILNGSVTFFCLISMFSILGLLNIIVYMVVLLNKRVVRYTNQEYMALSGYGVNTIIFASLGLGLQSFYSFTKLTKMPSRDKYEKYLVNGAFVTIYIDHHDETTVYPRSEGYLNIKVTQKINEESNITIHSLRINSSLHDNQVGKDNPEILSHQTRDTMYIRTNFLVTNASFFLNIDYQEILTILLDIEVSNKAETERKVIECKMSPTVEHGLVRIFS